MQWRAEAQPATMHSTVERHGWIYHAEISWDRDADEWDWSVARELVGYDDPDEVASGSATSPELAKRLVETCIGLPHLRSV